MTSVVPEGQWVGEGGALRVCRWVAGVGIWNRPFIAPLALLRCIFPLSLPVSPRHTHALALDEVRSAFHAILIATIPLAVGWFVTNRFLHPPRQMRDQEDERDSPPAKYQQQMQATRPIHADPPLELADLTLSFSRTPEHEIAVLSPLPRVPLPPKRVSRKLSRPLTASILDERRKLLPTSPSSGSLSDNSPIGTPLTDNDSSWPNTTPEQLLGESVTGDKPDAEIGIPLPHTIVESTVVDDHCCSFTGEFALPGGPSSTR